MSIRQADKQPYVLGWHDSHCASAAVLSRDGHVLYAAAEERFTKRKLQKGYPHHTFEDIGARFNRSELVTCYTDMPLPAKVARNAGLIWNTWTKGLNSSKTLPGLFKTALKRIGRGNVTGIVGSTADAVEKPTTPPQHTIGQVSNLSDHLCEHHTAHAASAYYLSGFDDAYIVTIDGVGDCLSGTVFKGEAGKLSLQRKFYYNDLTVAADYEVFTAMMGFDPDRHCGKITGLAAYGKYDDGCVAALEDFFKRSWRRGRNNYFDLLHSSDPPAILRMLRHLRQTRFGAFSRQDLAFAIQHLTEKRILRLIRDNVPDIERTNIALAGGVFANVRVNQKVKELGFANIFIQPAMDDGGLSLGAALHHLARAGGLRPRRLEHMFLGPGYSAERIQEALDHAGIPYERVEHLPYAVARLVSEGNVVARFDGRMEFGPRALGNRSILYATQDPSVNDWLNKRLGRCEFMPFAPATLADHADACYEGLNGCRHTAEFMTITFNCTDYMKGVSPAVVHVDGTARAQLVTPETNPALYEILEEYRKITGIFSLVNTSFNMHESPIVATPEDAVRSFQQGRLDYLAIGPFLAKADPDRWRDDAVRKPRTAELSTA